MHTNTRAAVSFTWSPKLVGLAVGLLVAGRAGAESTLGPGDHCTDGDASSIASAFFPIIQLGNEPANSAAYLCQFRHFGTPKEGLCFCEDDVFVGAGVWFEIIASPDFPGCEEGDPGCKVPYDGWSARESVSLFDAAPTVFLEPAGMPIETFATPVKDALHPTFGPVVWRQSGAIFRNLAPGRYTVLDDADHPSEAIFGEFDAHITTFHVLPHSIAHALGRPTDTDGSVRCPKNLR